MTGIATNVLVPGDAQIHFAPAGTALPATTAASLAAFGDLGYVSEDGVTFGQESTNNQVKAFNGDVVADTETEHSVPIEFTCLETNEEVLDIWYSGNYDTPAGTGVIKGGQVMRGVWVFDAIVAGGVQQRVVIPDGKVVARKSYDWKPGAAAAYGFTVQCFPDATGQKTITHHSEPGAS